MKKQIILLALSLAFLVPVLAAMPQGKPISPYSLPKKTQTFLRAHFAYGMPVSATKDNVQGYEVMMNDNSVIRFDRKGDWTEATCSEGVPETIIPLQIRVYITRRFEGVSVGKITRDRNGYCLSMANGMDLVFDNKGSFVTVK